MKIHKLELEGQWPHFFQQAEQTLGQPWPVVKDRPMAEELFSEVMHAIAPQRYTDPLSWYESRAGSQVGQGLSVTETTRAIAQMLAHRQPGRTLFVVVDEVSQYIYQNGDRMLRLQSFVEDLGKKLRGRVWLLATGQQKLEDSDDASHIGKLKDRFPPHLRVHLAPTNIRDVVHRRLLKKAPARESALRDLFQGHRADLQLYGYHCSSITEVDFLEVYPLLPGYVDLLMQIASNLRLQSTRAKGDDQAIRGLLQLIGEIFREQDLGGQELGALITLEHIYQVQATALSNETQTTLAQIFGRDDVGKTEVRAVKAVALLELVREWQPTTVELVSQCLYDRLGAGDPKVWVEPALTKLRDLGLLSYSEKTGYRLQSFAGQEWAREREDCSVTSDALSQLVAASLKELCGQLDKPRYKGRGFTWAVFYDDARQQRNERLKATTDLAVITIDFRYRQSNADRQTSDWIAASASSDLRDRLLWVVGACESLEEQARELGRSQQMLHKYEGRKQSLSEEKRRLLAEESSRCDRLNNAVKRAVEQAFLAGELYFRGRSLDKRQYGSGFLSCLNAAGEALLPELFDRYVEISVTPSELRQLLEANLAGISPKFMSGEGGFGLFELDAGKYAPTCSGEVPKRIEEHVCQLGGLSGSDLLSHFGKPPYGYAPDVVRACLAGLLRAQKIRIRSEKGDEITSLRDPGAQDMFTKDRDLRHADVLPPGKSGIDPRDRVSICRFFSDQLNEQVDRENDAIADAVSDHFPEQAKNLRELEQRLNRLPNRFELPATLQLYQTALEKCLQPRQVEPRLQAVKRHLDKLRDGAQDLKILSSELNDTAIAQLTQALKVREHQLKQLAEAELLEPVQAEAAALAEQLDSERPWREIASLQPQVEAIAARYQQVRAELLERQDAEAEQLQQQLQARPDYPKVSAQQGQYIVEPIPKAKFDTTAEAVYPSLVQLRDTAAARLQAAADEANRYLDEALSKVTAVQVVAVSLDDLLQGEIGSVAEVDSLLARLRDRLIAELGDQGKIRLRLK